MDEFEPFQIGEAPPEETELLIQEDIHIDDQPTTDLDEQLIIEPETEAEDEVRFYYTVTCYTTKTSLTYIFTPIATPNLQENTEDQNQTNTENQENTP